MKLSLIIFVLFLVFIEHCVAQTHQIEAGAAIGIGNIANKEYSLGKAEIHLSYLTNLKGSIIGMDFSKGGDVLIRGVVGQEYRDGVEYVNPYSNSFSSILLFYRYILFADKSWFLQPGVGYSSLHRFIHTDDTRKIRQPNLGAALTIGYLSQNHFTVSLRYQYYGRTGSYEGFRGTQSVVQERKHISLIMLRISGIVNLYDFFNKK
ncbi:MAG: hypothetical protein AAF843_03765 [Bacteroidota bacterium]